MTWFEGTHTETRTLPVPADVARAHLASPAAILAATKGVETSEIDGGTVHFVLEEEDHGVVKYRGDYRVTYALDGDTVRWSTAPGANYEASGTARVTGSGDSCELAYTETVKVDLGVPAMMAPMIKPVISAMVASEIKDFVKRLVAGLA